MIEMETEIRRGCKTVAEAIAIVKEQARINQGEYRTDKKHVATFIEYMKDLLINEQMSYQQDKIHKIFWKTAIKIYTADNSSISRAKVITMAQFTATALNQIEVLQRIDELDSKVSQDLKKHLDGS